MKNEPQPRAKVLVTGATGFLGKFLVRELETQGVIEVVQTSKSLGYDLRNEPEAMTCLWLVKPDIVVHLAKPSGLPTDANAVAFRDTMLMGMNVLQAAALARAKFILVVPPSIYDENSDVPNGEAEAKKALISACKAYKSQYGLPSLILGFSELYGPFARPQEGFLDVLSLINTFILAKVKNEPTVILPGTGEEKRQLLSVNDAAKAVAKAVSVTSDLDFLSLPGKDVVTEKDLAERIMRACGYTGKVEWDGDEESTMPPPVVFGDFWKNLGLVPETPLETALTAAVAIRMESVPMAAEAPKEAK